MGRNDRYKSIIFYNPITSSYYRPQYFRLDESRLPITNFPNSLCFHGVLTCGILINNTDPICEPFPPVTRVFIQHDNAPARGTINNISITASSILKCAASPSIEHSDKKSISSNKQESPPYVIILDYGTTFEKSYDNLIQDSRDDTSPPKSPSNAAALEGIPHFLFHDPKVTIDHKWEFHKGYINYSPEGGFQFLVRRNLRSRKVDFSVPLPDFKHHWTNLLGDNRFYPDHYTVRSFLKAGTSCKPPPHWTVYLPNIFTPHVHPLSLQRPWYLQPRPSSLARLFQRGETRSHRPWGLREDLQEPLPRPEKGRQYTKCNPLNVRLSH